MNTNNIVMCVIALILGMLMFHMLKNVCGCKNVVEGQNTCTSITSDIRDTTERAARCDPPTGDDLVPPTCKWTTGGGPDHAVDDACSGGTASTTEAQATASEAACKGVSQDCVYDAGIQPPEDGAADSCVVDTESGIAACSAESSGACKFVAGGNPYKEACDATDACTWIPATTEGGDGECNTKPTGCCSA